MEFFTYELLIRLIASFFCSIAFAVLFKSATRHLIPAGLSGVVTYFVYHLGLYFEFPLFAVAFLSTFAGASFAELYARMRKTLVTVILSAAIIPTVPGGDIYYTMQNVLLGNGNLAIKYLWQTMSIALGIAGGIVVVAIIFKIISDTIAKKKTSKT